MIKVSQKDYNKLLESVYERLTNDDELYFVENEGESDTISQRYLIDGAQVNILAYLSHFFPSRVVEDKLISVTEMRHAVFDSKITELVKRDFLCKSTMQDGTPCYSVMPECHDAFANGAEYGIPPLADCLSELKTARDESFMSEIWKQRFYKSCELPENKRFKDACEVLEIHQLDETTQSAFWILVSFFIKRFTNNFAFRGDEMVPDGNYGNTIKIKLGMGNLVKAGLAISMPIEPLEDSHETERYVLAPRVVKVMFHGCDELARYDEISKVTNVILAKNIVEKKLFFSEESQAEVDNLRKILSAEGFKRAETILSRQHRNPAIQSLFWGPPGTGKTEVIKQIARETGRDLLIFDAAKVTASAWGAAEKNYRALFLGYNYLAALCTKAPILLLNECDQLLAKRLTTMERAIDRCENTVSNIILQGFEDMSGILLATTNLATNLDSAFDRRFLFKTELTKPDAKARKCIWQSLVPELSESEAETLAERFEMTGGQISNVVAKRDLAELYYEGDRGLDYIVGLCKTELNEPTKGPRARRVGF